MAKERKKRKQAVYHPRSRQERKDHILKRVVELGGVTNTGICEDFVESCVGNCVTSVASVKPWVTRTLKAMVEQGVLTQSGGRGKSTTYEAGPAFPNQVPQ